MAKPDFQAGAGERRRAADQSAFEDGEAPRSDSEISELSDGAPTAKSTDKDWGFSKKKSGLRTETKLGIAFVLVLISAFGFMVYRQYEERRAQLLAIKNPETEEGEDSAEGETSPEGALTLATDSTEVTRAGEGGGSAFMASDTEPRRESVPTLSEPEVEGADSGSDDLDSVFGTQAGAVTPQQPTEPAQPDEPAFGAPEQPVATTVEPPAAGADPFAGDSNFDVASPQPEPAEPKLAAAAAPTTAPEAANTAAPVDDAFLNDFPEVPAEPASESAAMTAGLEPQKPEPASIPVIESAEPTEAAATPDVAGAFEGIPFDSAEPQAAETTEPQTADSGSAAPSVPELAKAEEPNEVPSFEADGLQLPEPAVAQSTEPAVPPADELEMPGEDQAIPSAGQGFAADATTTPLGPTPDLAQPDSTFARDPEGAAVPVPETPSIAETAEPSEFQADDQIPSFAQDRSSEPQVDGPVEKYAVQEADSLWAIATRFYGSPRYHRALYRFNERRIADPTMMKPGTELHLPSAASLEAAYPELFPRRESVEQVASDGSAPGAFFYDETGNPMYRVGKADTLSSIAERHLGRSSRWVQIYRLNQQELKNPDDLTIGSILRMPSDANEGGVTPSVFESVR